MAEPVRVSRQGLTRCPGCQSHIKLAENIAETTCPFCQSPAWSANGGPPRQLRLGSKGRALLTATLLGAAMTLTACPGGGSTNEKVTEQAQDAGPSPLYGIAPAPDSSDKPMYGLPPD